MLDFHTHILPGIDDGSKDVETSCKMINMLNEQSVDVIVATPHFYSNEISLEKFKKYRQNSLNLILNEFDKNKVVKRPKIALGAEVKFFYELNIYQNSEDLCIDGTRFMLIEMPFEKWDHRMYATLRDLKNRRDIIPVIAHVERYFPYNSKRDMMDHLVDIGALLQCNTSFFNSLFTRHKAFIMYKEGLIQFIGSDSHNLTNRKPDYGTTLNHIKNRSEGVFLKDLKFWEKTFLNSGVILY